MPPNPLLARVRIISESEFLNNSSKSFSSTSSGCIPLSSGYWYFSFEVIFLPFRWRCLRGSIIWFSSSKSIILPWEKSSTTSVKSCSFWISISRIRSKLCCLTSLTVAFFKCFRRSMGNDGGTLGFSGGYWVVCTRTPA